MTLLEDRSWGGARPPVLRPMAPDAGRSLISKGPPAQSPDLRLMSRLAPE